MNSRPITATSSDINDDRVLAPNTLILQKEVIIDRTEIPSEWAYSKLRWKRVKALAEQFWTRFKREYLAFLMERNKWKQSRGDLKPGDVVLIKDKVGEKGNWPLAKVVKVYEGSDGVKRSAVVKTGTNLLERPFVKLVKLHF